MIADVAARLHRVLASPDARQAARAKRRPTLALHFLERRLLLTAGDLLMLNLGLVTALAARPDITLTPAFALRHLHWFLLLSGLWLLTGALLNIYDLGRAVGGVQSLSAVGATALVTSIIFLLLPYVTPALPDARRYVLLLPIAVVIGLGLWRIFYASLLVHPDSHQRALVIGTGPTAQFLTRTIAQSGHRRHGSIASTSYRVIGFVSDDPTESRERIEELPVLGGGADLTRIIEEHRPDEIVIAFSRWQEATDGLLGAILGAQERGVRITTMTMLYEQLTGRLALEQAGGRFDIVLPLWQSASHRLYLALRRVVETAISLVGCLLVAALIPAVWVVNRFTSPGPLFYRQERIGKGGRPFFVVKFRSMIVDAEKSTGAVWAVARDSRITPLGRFLRKTRLDETPQFWNVLKGDMSLIGPRPERPEFVAQLSQDISFYRVRHSVQPGLTGWAQVKYCYASSLEDSRVKLQYDLYYVKHQRPALDLLILLRTAQIVLGFRGQ